MNIESINTEHIVNFESPICKNKEIMNIGIIGTGYVGLITGVCLAKVGHNIICMDHNKHKINSLRNGIPTIYEKGLKETLKMVKDNIYFTDNNEEGLKNNLDVIFLALPTPQNIDGEHNMSYIEESAKDIIKYVNNKCVIVVKSTVPVNTCNRLKKILKENDKNNYFHIASNPEFLREGKAIEDFFNPDRILIGVEDEYSNDILKKVYYPIIFNNPEKYFITDIRSAEIIKHASNSFLSMKISFSNMVSDLCDKVGANINNVMDGVGLDNRIGRSFLNAGLGFGGSCFSKDLSAFISILKENQCDSSLMESVMNINNFRIQKAINILKESLWSIENKKILILGKTFKPDTDDIRDSQSIKLGNILKEKYNCIVSYYDSILTLFKDIYDCSKNFDAIVIASEDTKFLNFDWNNIKKISNANYIIDLRNLFNKEYINKLREYGFNYKSIGRNI